MFSGFLASVWAFKICLGRSKPMVITKARTLNGGSRSFLLKASATTFVFPRSGVGRTAIGLGRSGMGRNATSLGRSGVGRSASAVGLNAIGLGSTNVFVGSESGVDGFIQGTCETGIGRGVVRGSNIPGPRQQKVIEGLARWFRNDDSGGVSYDMDTDTEGNQTTNQAISSVQRDKHKWKFQPKKCPVKQVIRSHQKCKGFDNKGQLQQDKGYQVRGSSKGTWQERFMVKEAHKTLP
nr:hypothetical protein [Tanacetum cinerariifolium]